MKRNIRKAVLLGAMLTAATSLHAYDFLTGDLYFNIISEADRTVEVTYKSLVASSQADYVVGDIEIPAHVIYANRSYTIVAVGQSAFRHCTGLTSVRIADTVTEIYDWAFHDCPALSEVTFPENLTTIGGGAFYDCSSLDGISFADNLTTLRNWAFAGCTSLTSVALPDAVTAIGTGVFSGCTSLADVTTGNSIYFIGASAFRDCTSLTDATLGSGMESLGDKVFQNCTSLRNLYCNSVVPPQCAGTLGAGIAQNATLHVPAGTAADYAQTSPWSDFLNIEEPGEQSGVSAIDAENGEVRIWSVSGENVYEGAADTLPALNPGIYIFRTQGRTAKVLIP